MQQLIYYSSWAPATTAEPDKVVADILTVATARNQADKITGALIACDGWFVQVLEGPGDKVRALYDEIARDPRHEGVTLIDVQPAEERFFDKWSMCAARLGRDEDHIIELLGRQDGFNPPEFSFKTAMSVLGIVRLLQR